MRYKKQSTALKKAQAHANRYGVPWVVSVDWTGGWYIEPKDDKAPNRPEGFICVPQSPQLIEKKDRRGLNLTQEDRRRGGKRSAEQAVRDNKGKFIGRGPKGETNGGKQ